MTQEEKDLLLIDLSARLPYRVQVFVEHDKYGQATLLGVNTKQFSITVGDYNWSCTSNIEGHRIEQYKQLIKPYLRPMSSMTEEERNEYIRFKHVEHHEWDGHSTYTEYVEVDEINNYFVWLNEHHFDYRDLIEKRLALEAPENMYKDE